MSEDANTAANETGDTDLSAVGDTALKGTESTVSSEAENRVPDLETIEAALAKEKHKHNFRRTVRSVIYALVIAAAAAVIVVVLLFPILQVTGTSMVNTLQDGDIVLSVNKSDYKAGDIVAFYYEDKILVKRIIAMEGDWVDMDGEGNVSVNGAPLTEPYVTDKAVGYCDTAFPIQVPDGKNFLMGDSRETSMDSRVSKIGCVGDEVIVGRIVFCVWPLADFGRVR